MICIIWFHYRPIVDPAEALVLCSKSNFWAARHMFRSFWQLETLPTILAFDSYWCTLYHACRTTTKMLLTWSFSWASQLFYDAGALYTSYMSCVKWEQPPPCHLARVGAIDDTLGWDLDEITITCEQVPSANIIIGIWDWETTVNLIYKRLTRILFLPK